GRGAAQSRRLLEPALLAGRPGGGRPALPLLPEPDDAGHLPARALADTATCRGRPAPGLLRPTRPPCADGAPALGPGAGGIRLLPDDGLERGTLGELGPAPQPPISVPPARTIGAGDRDRDGRPAGAGASATGAAPPRSGPGRGRRGRANPLRRSGRVAGPAG